MEEEERWQQSQHQGEEEAAGSHEPGLSEHEAERIFAHYDTDGDGKLGMQDVVEMIKDIKGTEHVNRDRILEAWEWDDHGKVLTPPRPNDGGAHGERQVVLTDFKKRLRQISVSKPDWIPRIRLIISRQSSVGDPVPTDHTAAQASPRPTCHPDTKESGESAGSGSKTSTQLYSPPVNSDVGECDLDQYISMQHISQGVHELRISWPSHHVVPDSVQSVGLDPAGEDWLDHAYQNQLKPGCCCPWYPRACISYRADSCGGAGHAVEVVTIMIDSLEKIRYLMRLILMLTTAGPELLL